MTTPLPRAVLFDVDGTLVDSNYLHIDAWTRAFEEVGVPVDAWRIHRRLGMDATRMLEELLEGEADRLGGDATRAHSLFFRMNRHRLRAFDGASALLRRLGQDGIVCVLATSASASELDMLLSALGIAPHELLTTNADDVSTAKPHPRLVQVALDRALVQADEAVFVGDSVWDMIAAHDAGVDTVGVLSGGVGAEELRAAGAHRIIENIADLVFVARPF